MASKILTSEGPRLQVRIVTPEGVERLEYRPFETVDDPVLKKRIDRPILNDNEQFVYSESGLRIQQS